MLTIVDYGVGKLQRLYGLQEVGMRSTYRHDGWARFAKPALVLPGVGAFGDAMGKLQALGDGG